MTANLLVPSGTFQADVHHGLVRVLSHVARRIETLCSNFVVARARGQYQTILNVMTLCVFNFGFLQPISFLFKDCSPRCQTLNRTRSSSFKPEDSSFINELDKSLRAEPVLTSFDIGCSISIVILQGHHQVGSKSQLVSMLDKGRHF